MKNIVVFTRYDLKNNRVIWKNKNLTELLKEIQNKNGILTQPDWLSEYPNMNNYDIKQLNGIIRNINEIHQIDLYNNYMNLSKDERKESLKPFKKSEIKFYNKFFNKQYDYNNKMIIHCTNCNTTLIEDSYIEQCNCELKTTINKNIWETTVYSKDKTKVLIRLNKRGKELSSFIFKKSSDLYQFIKWFRKIKINNMLLDFRYLRLPDELQENPKRYKKFLIKIDGGFLDNLIEEFISEKEMTINEFNYFIKNNKVMGFDGRIKSVIKGLE